MTSDSLIMVMTCAVVLSAIAMIAQAVMVFMMAKSIGNLKEQIAVFIPKAEGFLATAEKALVDNQQQIKEISSRAVSVLDSTQNQLVRVDAFVADATGRAKVQMDRLELVLDDTVTRVHHTIVVLNNGILKPVREINGVVSGLRAAMQHLVRGRNSNPQRVTSDEEMFI